MEFSFYQITLLTHSYIRYFILILLIMVIVRSLMGWIGSKSYGNLDNKMGLYLVIFTHLQLVAGITLYFISPNVKFSSETMSTHELRYWTVEHIFAMVIAVTLITIARSTSKRMSTDTLKFKRLAIFNSMAIIVIIATIIFSGRDLI